MSINPPLPSQGGDQLLYVAKVAKQRLGSRREVVGGDGRTDLAVLLEAGLDPFLVAVRNVVSDSIYLLLDHLVEADNPAILATLHDPLVEPAILVEVVEQQVFGKQFRELLE